MATGVLLATGLDDALIVSDGCGEVPVWTAHALNPKLNNTPVRRIHGLPNRIATCLVRWVVDNWLG